MFVPADEEVDPVLYSLGNPEIEGSVRFFVGNASLISRKYLVPRDRAIASIRFWFEKNELGEEVKWTSAIF